MIFAFILDNSVSMNRIFSENLSYLDCAKAAIEEFTKWEHRKPHRQPTKYLLATYDNEPIKCLSSEKELAEILKYTTATNNSNPGATMSALFDYLNANRTQAKLDVRGKGRYPAQQESTLIFWVTDGMQFSNGLTVTDRINIPGLKSPGADNYLEPFRWEQRLYTIALMHELQPVDAQVSIMSDVSGGQFWRIDSLKALLQCVNNCVGVTQPRKHPFPQPYQSIAYIEGVSVAFESHPENQTPRIAERVFVYANHSVSKHFPIPESFWPESYAREDGTLLKFPHRNAHPVILVSTKEEHHSLLEGFPVDRLSMEQTSVARELTKRPKGTCWTLFMQNSHSKPGPGLPFGFLKPIKEALAKVQLSHVWDYSKPFPSIIAEIDEQSDRLAQKALLTCNTIAGSIKPFKNSQNEKSLKIEENIYNVKKSDLTIQLRLLTNKLDTNSRLTQQELDAKHSLPIGEMGNYALAMATQQLLRNPLEDESVRKMLDKSLFGNPYKKAPKKSQQRPDATESDSETLNEVEEEASHEFKTETVQPKKVWRSKLNRRAVQKQYPPISKKSGFVVPLFKDLTWKKLRSIDFDLVLHSIYEKNLVDTDQVENDPDSISSIGAESLNGPLQDRMEIDDLAETVVGDPEPVFFDVELIEPVSPRKINEVPWLTTRQNIHHLMTKWPGEYNENDLLQAIQTGFDTTEWTKDVADRLLWVRNLAIKFNRPTVIQYIDMIDRKSV
ncbi:Integrator complex subunit 6-like [Terramyces sp. JEL0728]|nr:Integrator complex subunit 6-like [Terramyces sp. JEL0728]